MKSLFLVMKRTHLLLGLRRRVLAIIGVLLSQLLTCRLSFLLDGIICIVSLRESYKYDSVGFPTESQFNKLQASM